MVVETQAVETRDWRLDEGEQSKRCFVCKVKSLYEGEETMKRPILIIVSVVIVFVLVGSILMNMMYMPALSRVNSAYAPGLGGGGAPDYANAVPQESPAYDALGAPLPASEEAKNTVVAQAQERFVIKNADLAIVVEDPETRMKEISDLAVAMGGYVVTSNLYQTYYGPNSIEVPEATVTIRVPSEQLEAALEKIKEGSSDVQYENITGEDVTSVYVDLQSQLKAKQAAEKKLLEILDAANETEDVLAVYQQLQLIQSEIEVLKGQIKYYDESTSTSAISVRLIAEETVQPVEIGGWKLQGTANDAIQDLIYFTQGFAQFLIRLFLTVLPSLILMAIPLYLAFLGGRALFRRFGKSKETKVEETKEKK